MMTTHGRRWFGVDLSLCHVASDDANYTEINGAFTFDGCDI